MMDSIVKKESKIKSQTENPDGGFDYVLEDNSWLGDSFSFLPNGRINKKETGIGATSLEISSLRNSIIVFPTRQTAKSKSSSDVFYFEVPESKKLSLGREAELESYLLLKKNKYKKILVVADSLETLITYLLSKNIQVYSEFFLLIDEIDSIQLDSSFRMRMELCIEYYKKFPIENRAVVSATLLNFSDPELQNEKLTKFNWFNSPNKDITLVQSIKPIETAVEHLISVLNTNEKVVFALNGVELILGIAEYLIENKVLKYNEISILCGQNRSNNEKTKKFSQQPLGKTYPSRLNFITAAFFTGYDINESYKLIIVVDNNFQHTRISENQVIQIIGRCRKPNKLYNVDFFFNLYNKPIVKRTIKELVDSANNEIEAFKCISNRYGSHKLLQEKAIITRNLLIENSGFNGFNFVKIASDETYQISYLNIDSFIENQRVKNEVYRSDIYLKGFFNAENYKVVSKIENSTLDLEFIKKKKQKQIHDINSTIQFLEKTRGLTIEKVMEYKLKCTGLSIEYCEFYLLAHNYLGKNETINRIKKSDTKLKTKKLIEAYKAQRLSKNDFKKRNILLDFPINKKFNTEELNSQISKTLLSISEVGAKSISPTKAKKMIEYYVELKLSTENNQGKKVKIYKVESHNPFKFRGLSSIKKDSVNQK